MSFTLRALRDPSKRIATDHRGVFVLKGEVTWVLEAPRPVLDRALSTLGAFATDVSAGLMLEFGNAVGVFRVPEIGTIEVVSGKWTHHHFDSMVADIAREASALPFSAGTSAPLPYERTIATRDDVLYHAFVYLRHILSESAPRQVRLMPSLRAILADPHRRTRTDEHQIPIEQARSVGPRAIVAIATGSGPLVSYPRLSRRLPSALDGHMPRRLPEPRVQVTADTPENRFVKAFLALATTVVRRMRETTMRSRKVGTMVLAECDELEALLAPIVRAPLWRDVGTMTQVPAGSTVLQRRRGYRDVFRHYSLLRLATKHLPLTAHEARDLLEAKDIALLYELWSYFMVVQELRAILGRPRSATSIRRDDFGVDLPREFAVEWPDGTGALYNASFSRSNSERRSYSVPLRPDVVVALPNGDLHILDAKFRMRHLTGDADDDDRAEAKRDDIYKMHAYRDAIDNARSAFVLYPGTEEYSFPAEASSSTVTGVGAIPLRPGSPAGGSLRSFLARILERPERGAAA